MLLRILCLSLYLLLAPVVTAFVPSATTPTRTTSPALFVHQRPFTVLRTAITGTIPYGESDDSPKLPRWKAEVSRAVLQMFIVSMCLALPATLLPQSLLFRMGLLNRQQKEHYALVTAAFCARWLLRIFPFCDLSVTPCYVAPSSSTSPETPVPTVWVCNHLSFLDVFLLLAADKRLRGRNRRPIKIVYWKQLEKNPISRLLFRQAGFIPVDMEANGSGTPNEYSKQSFKKLLKDCKQAFEEGFDIGILPEGQLNPTPEKGLLPVFSGAYTLAKMSRRPIQMIALYGANKVWPAEQAIQVESRQCKIRGYPVARVFGSADEFKATFSTVVGYFGAHGRDLPTDELREWLKGSKWEELLHQNASEEQSGSKEVEQSK